MRGFPTRSDAISNLREAWTSLRKPSCLLRIVVVWASAILVAMAVREPMTTVILSLAAAATIFIVNLATSRRRGGGDV